MAYFGGGGVTNLHPSLRAYIECFDSAPFPKVYPRGGGVWDQDPILMRDFRIIRKFEVDWKENQDKLQAMRGQDMGLADGPPEGGATDLEGMLEEMLDERGQEDGYF